MNTPIYQIFYIKNRVASNQAWKALSETERSALIEQERASRAEVKAKAVVVCDSAWADEEHPTWDVLSFPDLTARIQHTNSLRKIGWLDLVEAFTLLGTSDKEPEAVTIPNPIYKLWIGKLSPAGMGAYRELSKGLEAALWEKHNAVYEETGSKVVLSAPPTGVTKLTHFSESAYIPASKQIKKLCKSWMTWAGNAMSMSLLCWASLSSSRPCPLDNGSMSSYHLSCIQLWFESFAEGPLLPASQIANTK